MFINQNYFTNDFSVDLNFQAADVLRQVLDCDEGDSFALLILLFASTKCTIYISEFEILFLNSENRLGRQREDIEWPEDDDEDNIKAEIDGFEVAPDIPTSHNCKNAK